MTKDNPGDVFTEIGDILKANGSVTQPTRDRLMLMAVSAIHAKVMDVMDALNVMTVRQNDLEDCQEKQGEEIKDLKRISIINWIDRHPKLSLALAIFFVLLINSDFIKIVLALAGFPDLIK
jgi:hypothetical protein